IYSLQWCTANFQGRAPIIRRNVSAHHRERSNDSLHRPRKQRRVAEQSRGEILAGKNSGQQAHGGAAVFTVERPRGCAQAVNTCAVNYYLAAGRLNLYPELSQTRERGPAIGTGRIVRDP